MEAQPAALWPVSCTREEIQQVMGRSVRALMDALAAQGVSPAGPLFTHHLRRPTDTFEFHLGVPVDKPRRPRAGRRPAARRVAGHARGAHRVPRTL